MSLFNGDCRLRICELGAVAVHRWFELGSLEPDAVESRTEERFMPMTELRHILPKPPGASPKLKYHTLGFQYVGPRLVADRLGPPVKEAYGVEQDGIQHVLLVLNKTHGVRADSCCMVPYRLGLVSQWIKITQVRVYKKTQQYTDDPILDAIIRGGKNKWIWKKN